MTTDTATAKVTNADLARQLDDLHALIEEKLSNTGDGSAERPAPVREAP